MIKCPNCGSTSQPKPIDRQIAGSVYYPTLETTYKCGCGRLFVTLISIRVEDEIIIDPNV
jgi:DNA-directed RNA polymerase subunit RPC12/RpoP